MKLKHTCVEKAEFVQTIILRIFHVMAILWMGYLFFMCLRYTGLNPNSADEHIVLFADPILKNILKLGIGILLLVLLGWFYDTVGNKIPHFVWVILACVFSGVLSFWAVAELKVAAIADQSEVFGHAIEYSIGSDYSKIMFEKGRYMSNCSQNIGLMTLEVLLIRAFKNTTIMPFQYFVASMVPVGVLAGHQITWHLSRSRKASFIYLYFAVTCVPMYFYVPFVYGDLISSITLLGMVWCFLSAQNKWNIPKAIMFGLLAGVAVQLRGNSAICVIACGVVLLISMLTDEKKKTITLFAAAVAGVILLQMGGKVMYSIPQDAKPIPAINYIYMGMNDDNGYAGWYNSSNIIWYATYDFDQTETRKHMRQLCIERMREFAEEPEYFQDFLKRKILTQWEVPMYHALPMTYANEEERSLFVREIYDRNLFSKGMENYMKIYQLLLYGGLFLGGIITVRKKQEPFQYVLLIAGFGYFLFSILWETKTRYILQALLLLTPYMALMQMMVSQKIHGLLKSFSAGGTKKDAI